MFGFPFNGDTMILPDIQEWKTDEIELSRRMIKARDSRAVRTTPQLLKKVKIRQFMNS